MISESEFNKAVKLIERSSKVLIVSHTRPDGDACGSMKALYDALSAIGKHVQPIYLSPIASWYEFVFNKKIPVLGNDLTCDEIGQDYDLVIIVDTNSYVQLPVFENWLKSYQGQTLVIDHHLTGDGLGDIELIDSDAAAAGEIVYDLLNYAKWPITKEIAEALFVAYSTDSGWFRFGNTDARLLKTAADMVSAGAVPSKLYRKLFQNYSLSRIKLMVRMLESLELVHDGRMAIQHILRTDFDQVGAEGRDTENLIDECQRIGSVEVAVLLVELGENEKRGDSGFRCSLRSKGDIDVRVIAQKYGGGGHAVAAGVNMEGTLEQIKETLIHEVAMQLS